MAPKPADKAKKEAAAAKAKAKQKAAEDKTFGLKNKNKSAKVQKYVQGVTSTAVGVSLKDKRAQELAEKAKKEKKAAEEARKKELEALFATAIKQPKVPPGVDPKSVVCEFFRHGQCTKGFKCKFSHDLNVERKAAKIDLFTDQRDIKGDDEEGMDDWDQETLERVVKEKHGAEKPSNATTIICKFFLDAVEKRQYGWFWKCPNGSDCKYRHALPPGYVLKSQMKELLEEEASKARDITEVIEEERSKVEAKTPINQQVFEAWHARKKAEREARRAADADERRKKGLLNGREIFLQDNFVAQDDVNAGGDDEYAREDDDEQRINEMFEQARKAQEAARQSAAATPAEQQSAEANSSSADATAGASSSKAAAAAAAANGGPSSSRAAAGTTLDDEHAALFEGDSSDDDDDEELLEDDSDDDDLDPEQLTQLEQQLAQKAAVS